MAYYIRLERKEDIVWLQNILDRAVAKCKASPNNVPATIENVYRVADAVASFQETDDAAAMGVPKEVLDQDEKPKPKPNDNYVPNLCPKHPKYGAKRVPGKECEGCWNAYKKFHPLEYEKALRNFNARTKPQARSSS
jgi:hypothetical protein